MNIEPGDFIRTRDGRGWRVAAVEPVPYSDDHLIQMERGEDGEEWSSTLVSWQGRTWWVLRAPAA